MNETETKKGRRRWPWVAVLSGVMLLSVGLILLQFRSGIRVTVQNAGAKPIRSVVLHVTGRSYPVGDIAPGDFAEATVNPTGESQLEIQFSDADGKQRRLPVDCYFEPGYRGVIHVAIKDDRIAKIEERINLR